MTLQRLVYGVLALLACGLIAAGCGDDDSTTATTATTATTEETTSEDTTAADEGDASAGGVDADGVYDACIDVIEGTPGEAAGQSVCESTRSAFEECAKQADAIDDATSRDSALKACQEAADKSVEALNAAG